VLALFDRGSTHLSLLAPRRIELGEGCWIDHQPGFLKGHEELLQHLVRAAAWKQRERWMVDRRVLEPRLTATVEPGEGHAVLWEIVDLLCERYRAQLRHLTLSYYRSGRDSVAPHGDRGEASQPGAVTVSVSLGFPRKLLLKPVGGGSSRAFNLGWGDLFVMGGAIQRHWLHGVPKCRHAAPRLACLFWLAQSAPRSRASRA